MYTNEVLSDENFETYIFQYSESSQIININISGENDNILVSMLPKI